mmetsp:Transcript_5079/g.20392  ORF Transcript_5079/g.20392 Transcript_5079/m.20392 type:complete len:220 (+) Transcript_5079:144-803(+)
MRRASAPKRSPSRRHASAQTSTKASLSRLSFSSPSRARGVSSSLETSTNTSVLVWYDANRHRSPLSRPSNSLASVPGATPPPRAETKPPAPPPRNAARPETSQSTATSDAVLWSANLFVCLNRASRNACVGSGRHASRAPAPTRPAKACTVSREVFEVPSEPPFSVETSRDSARFCARISCLYTLFVPCVATTHAHPSSTSTLAPARSPATSPPPKLTW